MARPAAQYSVYRSNRRLPGHLYVSYTRKSTNGQTTRVSGQRVFPDAIFDRYGTSGQVCYISISTSELLLLTTGDMVNMLDKIPAISSGAVKPHIIIRVATGPDTPVHPGHQHVGNYAQAFKRMFDDIEVVELNAPEHIMEEYKYAYEHPGAYLIVEHGNLYGPK